MWRNFWVNLWQTFFNFIFLCHNSWVYFVCFYLCRTVSRSSSFWKKNKKKKNKSCAFADFCCFGRGPDTSLICTEEQLCFLNVQHIAKCWGSLALRGELRDQCRITKILKMLHTWTLLQNALSSLCISSSDDRISHMDLIQLIFFFFVRYYDPGEESEGFCQLYRGAACSKYLENKSIYVTSKVQQGRMEERLTGKNIMSLEFAFSSFHQNEFQQWKKWKLETTWQLNSDFRKCTRVALDSCTFHLSCVQKRFPPNIYCCNEMCSEFITFVHEKHWKQWNKRNFVCYALEKHHSSGGWFLSCSKKNQFNRNKDFDGGVLWNTRSWLHGRKEQTFPDLDV